MSYREIRVRPVVRYVVTDFICDDDYGDQKSIPFGEFDNVDRANVVAHALADAESALNGTPKAIVETARKLRIDWLRGPGEPKEAIRWELSDPDAPGGFWRPCGCCEAAVWCDRARKCYRIERGLGLVPTSPFQPRDPLRRCDTLRHTDAEQAICAAIDAVESVGADPWLTDAVVLLGSARNKVADYVDREDMKAADLQMARLKKGLETAAAAGSLAADPVPLDIAAELDQFVQSLAGRPLTEAERLSSDRIKVALAEMQRLHARY